MSIPNLHTGAPRFPAAPGSLREAATLFEIEAQIAQLDELACDPVRYCDTWLERLRSSGAYPLVEQRAGAVRLMVAEPCDDLMLERRLCIDVLTDHLLGSGFMADLLSRVSASGMEAVR